MVRAMTDLRARHAAPGEMSQSILGVNGHTPFNPSLFRELGERQPCFNLYVRSAFWDASGKVLKMLTQMFAFSFFEAMRILASMGRRARWPT